MTIRGVVQRESLQGFYLQRLASLFPRVAEHLEHLRGNQAVFVQTECFRGYSLLSPIPVGSALMGYLIRLRVYERVGVSLVEVCEWVGKSVISVVKRLKRAAHVKKTRKRSVFVVYSYFKDSEFTSAIKMDGKS